MIEIIRSAYLLSIICTQGILSQRKGLRVFQPLGFDSSIFSVRSSYFLFFCAKFRCGNDDNPTLCSIVDGLR